MRAVEATGATSVYVHIDLDVLDPAAIDGIGSPEPFGVLPEQLTEAIRALRRRFDLAGAGLTEFAPASPDAADATWPVDPAHPRRAHRTDRLAAGDRQRRGGSDSLGGMSEPKILTERRGHVLLIGLNRPEKRNAADFELLQRCSPTPTASSSATPSCGSASSTRSATTSPAGSTSPTSARASAPTAFVRRRGRHRPVAGLRAAAHASPSSSPCRAPASRSASSSCSRATSSSRPVDALRADRGGPRHPAVRRRDPPLPARGRLGQRHALDPHRRPVRRGRGATASVSCRRSCATARSSTAALELAERIAAQAPLAVQAALANAKRAVRDGDAAAEAELQPALVRAGPAARTPASAWRRS